MPSCASWPSAWCVRRKNARRLSRDLHDGISQWLVSIKLQIEAALERLRGTPEQAAAARAGFEKTATQINGVLAEVRRISHDLRPAILDDLGLAAALEHLCGEWREQPRSTDRLR
jgi:two-component system NarL family sensor kinase